MRYQCLVLFVVAVWGAMPAAVCQSASADPGPDIVTKDVPVVINPLEKLLHPDRTKVDPRLVSAYNTFGFNLLRQVAAQEKDRNILVSPLSIAVALTMTLNGAANKTRQDMTTTLQLETLALAQANQANADLQKSLGGTGANVRLVMANSLWTRRGLEFNADFLDTNRKFFGARVASLDFNDPQARTTINQWVEEATQGKIRTLVDQLDGTTDMVLTNAIYFKGKWQVEFDKTKTSLADFQRADGQTRQVPMMSQSGPFLTFQGNHCTAVNLPYVGDRISLIILLPDQDTSLPDVLQTLNSKNWQQWIGHQEIKRGFVALPRFKIEDDHKLNAPLQALGMATAFGPQADFSNLSNVAGLRLSEVRHKTFVEVNEEGTEAAAATSVLVTRGGTGFSLVANRPFLAAIVDNETGSLLFLSLVTDPQ